MSALDSPRRYDTVSKGLHWLIALLAFTQLGMGKFFEIEAGESGSLFDLHTPLGLLVLVLMLVRLAWRFTHAVPASLPGVSSAQRVLAMGMHAAFYALLIVLPLSDWVLTSIEGDPVSFFGWFPVSSLPVGSGEEMEEFVEEAHELLGNVLLALAALHVLASLKHHFIDRDDVLRRMLPSMN